MNNRKVHFAIIIFLIAFFGDFCVFGNVHADAIISGGHKNNKVNHPMLFFSRDDIPHLKEKANNIPGFLNDINYFTRIALKKRIPSYNDLPGGQSIYLELGEIIPVLAMKAMLTGKEGDIKAVEERVNKYVAYPHWGKGVHRDRGIEASHILFGVICAYDWLFDYIDGQEAESWKNKIELQASRLYEAAVSNNHEWWSETYNQNQNQINYAVLFSAGVLLREECKEAEKWIEISRNNFDAYFRLKEKVMDGSEAEGSGYASFGQHFVIIYSELLLRHFGVDVYSESKWLKNLMGFYSATSFPGFRHSDGFCDSRFMYYVLPTHILYSLDNAYKTGYGTWLANRLIKNDGRSYTRIKSLPFELIFMNPGVQMVKPPFATGLVVFKDWGTAFFKDSVDSDGLYVGFKCSAPGGLAFWNGRLNGSLAMERYNVGHCHPDANSFFLHPEGKLFLTDSGYEIPKKTENHNTVIFDETGQEGEGHTWFGSKELAQKKETAHLIAASSKKGYSIFAGEAAAAYPERLGIDTFFRQLLVMPGGGAVVFDSIELSCERQVTHCFNSLRNKFEVIGNKKVKVVTEGQSFILRRAFPEKGEFSVSVARNDKLGVNIGKAKISTEQVRGISRYVHLAFPENKPITDISLDIDKSGKVDISFSYDGRKYDWLTGYENESNETFSELFVDKKTIDFPHFN